METILFLPKNLITPCMTRFSELSWKRRHLNMTCIICVPPRFYVNICYRYTKFYFCSSTNRFFRKRHAHAIYIQSRTLPFPHSKNAFSNETVSRISRTIFHLSDWSLKIYAQTNFMASTREQRPLLKTVGVLC